jgi:hypothetical protein
MRIATKIAPESRKPPASLIPVCGGRRVIRNRVLRSHLSLQTAARGSPFKELSASNHLLLLPSLKALLVKKSGAISAAHLASREAFNALTAVCGTSSRVVYVDSRRIDSEVRHDFLQNAKLNRNANNAAKVVPRSHPKRCTALRGTCYRPRF